MVLSGPPLLISLGLGGWIIDRASNGSRLQPREASEETERKFFTPNGRNPLKSPDFEKINASKR